jgi:hypothetical protein
MIVLRNFNRYRKKELNMDQLLKLLQDEGVVFYQKPSLVKYPVLECLHYIALVSGKPIDKESK